MAIVDDHMKAYERELVLDEAVRRKTNIVDRKHFMRHGDLRATHHVHCGECNAIARRIRDKFRRIMAAA